MDRSFRARRNLGINRRRYGEIEDAGRGLEYITGPGMCDAVDLRVCVDLAEQPYATDEDLAFWLGADRGSFRCIDVCEAAGAWREHGGLD